MTDTCSEIPDKPIQQHGKSILVQVQTTRTEDRRAQRTTCVSEVFCKHWKKEKKRAGWLRAFLYCYIPVHSFTITSTWTLEKSRWGQQYVSKHHSFRLYTVSDFTPCWCRHYPFTVCLYLLSGRTKHPSHSHLLGKLLYRWNQCSTRNESVHDERDKTRN